MGKVGKISVIPKDYSEGFATMEKSLRQNGMTRTPGTVVMKFPYKELSGKYRTGLDENAASILKIGDDHARSLEQARIKKLRQKLEAQTGMDLSPTSPFYNHVGKGPRDTYQGERVKGIKMIDGDNLFNLDDPWQAITYYWLCAHPTIASSLQAFSIGQYPSNTVYYVADDEIEATIEYNKRKSANDAIVFFSSWSLEKRRKVARLLDLPASEDTKEEIVYNLVDSFLKAKTVARGAFMGQDPIRVFTVYAQLKDDVIYVKDVVKQALDSQIYRERMGGRIFEGEQELYQSEEELVEHLLDDRHQNDLFELEKKIAMKKSISV